MATMNISLSDKLREYVESCVAEGRLSLSESKDAA